ncbi:MAG: hypothetical protein E7505_01210 [Ruminococcus sp.]|nr:hypothetical protein [Ruminococcus sp.]
MKKKYKGSAMLWAVCSLLIITFVLTGLLALNKSYAEEEITNIASRRAEYLARSGVELTAGLIRDNRLSEEKTSDKLIVKEKQIVIDYEWGKVEVMRTGTNTIRLVSGAESADVTCTVIGIMEYDVVHRTWGLKGYVTY